MVSNTKSKKREVNIRKVALTLSMVLAGVAVVVGVIVYYGERILPGVRVANVNVGGMKIADAYTKLVEMERERKTSWLMVAWQENRWNRSLGELEVECDTQETLRRAFMWGRGSIGDWVSWRTNIDWVCQDRKGKLAAWIKEIALTIDREAIEPKIEIEDGKVEIRRGKNGQTVDQGKTVQEILDRIARNEELGFSPFVAKINWELNEGEIEYNRTRAEKLLASSITLGLQDKEWIIVGNKLVEAITLPAGFSHVIINNWLDEIGKEVEQEVRDATLVIEGNRVTEFDPGREGLTIDMSRSIELVANLLEEAANEAGENKVELVVSKVEPQRNLGKTNNLGIKDLLGKGESSFKGSIPNRVHNLSLAALRVRGVLVAPGEIFSFNKELGEVDARTGYRQAYVIEKGRTVLGDGGGVCQVSTTLFRGSLNAGLPIVERKAHAYRVGYYEQDAKPGLDATVFSPSVDFKFRNDTPGYLLVWNRVEKEKYKMYFEIYGTSDGREVNLTTPVILSQSAALPDLWQDDPTLPVGTVKQVDWKANGAKVKFDYQVKRGGEVVFEKQFLSQYRPWQAVFLRGVKPI